MSAGLRYEYVSAPKEVEDRIDYVYEDDTNNIEPRARRRLVAADARTASSGC